MMFVRSSKIIPHLVIIRVKKHGCQEQFWFLVADPLNIFSCESPNDLFVDTNNECEILCRIHHFIWIWLKKMATMGDSCFWLGENDYEHQ
jgi:hypothetical protein